MKIKNIIIIVQALIMMGLWSSLDKELNLQNTYYEAWDEGIENSTEDTEIFMEYLEEFIDEAYMRGVDLKYVLDREIKIGFIDTKVGSAMAISWASDLDGSIFITVNTYYWGLIKNENTKKSLLYHEFIHDILNLNHTEEAGNIMTATMNPRGTVSDERLRNMLDEVFVDYLKGNTEHYNIN